MNDSPNTLPAPDLQTNAQAAMDAMERGDLDTAAPLFEILNKRWPQFAPGWHFHGLLKHMRGESERAITLLRRAHALAPQDVTFLINFGTVLAETGRTEEALGFYERARKIEPDHPQLLGATAQLMLGLEKGDVMVEDIERQLDRHGEIWELWLLLGQCRQQGGDQAGAIEAYKQAVQHAPKEQVDPLVQLGQSARHFKLDATAEEAFKTALKRRPDTPSALLGLGYLASDSGNFEEARRLYRKALALQPGFHPAWDALSTITPASGAAALAGELDDIMAGASGPDDWHLYFARGRARERSGDYDGAFADYVAGNRPRIPGQAYPRDAQADYTRNIIEHLDRSFVKRRPQPQPTSASPRPIFICGMHRSGSTLLETILAAHPRVQAGGEMRFIDDWVRRGLGSDNSDRIGSWLAARTDAELGELARDWHQHLRNTAADHDFITDKLPANVPLLGLIKVCFPDAAIIHIHRDARDNCFSCFATPFEQGYLFASTLESITHFYRLHEQFMTHWRRVLGPDRLIEVGYEQLVGNPESEIRRLLAALDLEWDPRCLEFHKTARRVGTASAWQVRQPLYSGSIGRWRHFESHLAPLLDALAEPNPL